MNNAAILRQQNSRYWPSRIAKFRRPSDSFKAPRNSQAPELWPARNWGPLTDFWSSEWVWEPSDNPQRLQSTVFPSGKFCSASPPPLLSKPFDVQRPSEIRNYWIPKNSSPPPSSSFQRFLEAFLGHSEWALTAFEFWGPGLRHPSSSRAFVDFSRTCGYKWSPKQIFHVAGKCRRIMANFWFRRVQNSCNRELYLAMITHCVA